MDGKAVVLIATAGARDEAEKLGEGLVERRLAACVSVVPMIHSMYRDEAGRLVREHESMLIVKTSAAGAEAAQAYLVEHHSYDVPEVLRLEVAGGSQKYLDWLAKAVG
ncbi:MAG: divalent-cation tolerance protein CutA [Candidatus Dormibacteraceae bacterium]